MATRNTFFRVKIGDVWLCVEDGGGHLSHGEAPMYDHVMVSIREDRKGKPGAITSRTMPAVHRHDIAAIAMQFLTVAHAMTPHTTYNRSESVGVLGKEPRMIPAAWDIDPELVKQFMDEVTPKAVLQAYERLRRRVHILQSCVTLLERMPDDQAKQLGGLLSWLENHDDQRVAIHVTALDGDHAGALHVASPSQAKH